jgi:hypothetical protein
MATYCGLFACAAMADALSVLRATTSHQSVLIEAKLVEKMFPPYMFISVWLAKVGRVPRNTTRLIQLRIVSFS